jgi:adenylate cyclase
MSPDTGANGFTVGLADAARTSGTAAPTALLGEDDGPVRLLVVDDEPDVGDLFRVRFRNDVRKGGLTIHFAENGVRALEVLEDDPDIDVVVTDLNMPEMDGLALLQRITELERPLRTIVLSAYGDMANIRAAMRRGAFDFQVKPLDIDDLRATLAKAVQIVRVLRAGEEAQEMATTLAARNEYLKDVFGRYVSDDVVSQLLDSPDGPELRGERRTLTVMMADIRGFTALTEALPPERVVGVLNGYLNRAADAILRWRGTINEILGDGLLVFFGAPIPDPDAAEHAVAAALELQLAMTDLNARHRQEGLPELAVGIGIHTGEAIVGTIGSDRRMKYAAVGRNVNQAGRIESHTVGGQILISDDTHGHVAHLAEVTGRFESRAKGLAEPMVMHEVNGLAGDYGLRLAREVAALQSLTEAMPVKLARVDGKTVLDSVGAELLAVGKNGARLTTSLEVQELDDVAMWTGDGQLYGKVSECDVGVSARALTVVFTSVPPRAAEWLDGLGCT